MQVFYVFKAKPIAYCSLFGQARANPRVGPLMINHLGLQVNFAHHDVRMSNKMLTYGIAYYHDHIIKSMFIIVTKIVHYRPEGSRPISNFGGWGVKNPLQTHPHSASFQTFGA